MSKPKILIYAPREEPEDILHRLESAGCDIAFGDKGWQLPRGDHEQALADAARDAVALMGTSIRHTPITRRVMEASQRLRIVANTQSALMTWTPKRRPISGSWSAMRRQNPIASALRKPP